MLWHTSMIDQGNTMAYVHDGLRKQYGIYQCYMKEKLSYTAMIDQGMTLRHTFLLDQVDTKAYIHDRSRDD